VARGIRLAVEAPPSAERPARVYNLATGTGTTLHALAHAVCQALGSRSEIVPPDRRSEEGDRVADMRRAKAELKFEPGATVAEGLARLLEGASAR
jgi:nucleoside-diphosphate-sugar epimerase